ncbi:CK1/TTBK protein kinase [Aphelenchoides fujianensis]|nr:CK1/TTBK protein kinase [Aphelenchoides fujianensis]
MPTKEDLKAIQLPVGALVNRTWKARRSFLRASSIYSLQVTKKLGEGGCGVVYEVANAKTPHVRAALKSEPFGMHEDDELLKMEVHVLRKLPNGRHVCRLLATGKILKKRQVAPNAPFDWEAGGRHADVFKAGGPKPNERTKATDLKRVCDLRTKCEVTEIGEREVSSSSRGPPRRTRAPPSHISGVSANDDTLVNVRKIE